MRRSFLHDVSCDDDTLFIVVIHFKITHLQTYSSTEYIVEEGFPMLGDITLTTDRR